MNRYALGPGGRGLVALKLLTAFELYVTLPRREGKPPHEQCLFPRTCFLSNKGRTIEQNHRDYWITSARALIANSTASLLTDLLTDGVVFAYALWTIACNATVVLEGNARYGLTLAAIITATSLLTIATLLWKRQKWREAYLQDLRQSPYFPETRLSDRARLAFFLALAIVVISWITTRNPWVVWIEVVIGYCVASFCSFKNTSLATPQSETKVYGERAAGIALFGLAFVCMAFTLFAFRPRSDESFYSSLAVSVSNYPDLAVLKYNTIHGLATDFFSKQRLFAPYRVHSFELLGGYLSYLSGIDAVGIVHLVIAPFFGWLAPLAIARLLRVLTPRYWLPALFIALSFYFIEGSAGRGFANQAFVRLFNGKSVMLTVAVPLLFTYGLRFGSKPTVSRFVLLACSQIAAVGLSSTGIWMAPLITVISVAVALPPRRAALRTFGLSAVSSGYVLLLGLWVVGQMNASAPSAVSIARASGSVPPSIALPSFTLPSFAQLGNVLLPVFGNETTAIAHLSSFALVCVFARTSVTWRLFAVLGFVLSAGLANPFLINAVQSYVTGQLTYERIFWIIPLPIALGIWSTDLLLFAKKAVRVWIADLMVLVVIAGYYFTATDRLVISKANGAQMTFPPMVKMWPQERQVARRVCDYVKNDKYVLAPERVSLQLGSIANCGIPLISAIRWMSAPPAEIERRTKLVSLVGATNISLDWTEAFIESLDKYRISAVVTAKKASRDRWIRELLTQAGFSNKDTVNGHLIWVREDKAHSKALSRSRKIAQTTCRLTSRARYVLAPFGVSRQLALLDKCARPLIAFHPAEVGVRLEYRELRRLDDLVSRKADLHGEEIDWFRRAIENNNVGAVVIYGKAVENQNVQAILNELGFVENIFGKTPFLIRDSWVIGEP